MRRISESFPHLDLHPPVLAEEERRQWFQGGQRSVPSAMRWNGGRVPYCVTEHIAKGVERQVVLHETEPSRHPLRCRPRAGELEELVGEAEEC